MDFSFDFFKRKTPTPTAAPTAERKPDEMETLQLEIEMAHARINSMRSAVQEHDQHLGQMSPLSERLKIQLSQGDAGASVRLDELDKAELRTRRLRDGLLGQIAEAEIALQPLQARMTVLAQAADQRRQDEFVASLEREMHDKLNELENVWRRGCELSYDLVTLLSKSTPSVVMSGASGSLKQLDLQHPGAEIVAAPISRSLDQKHRDQVVALRNVVDRRMQTMRLARVNERWAATGLGEFRLEITPAKPRDIAVINGGKSA
jgi:hypothetical protein